MSLLAGRGAGKSRFLGRQVCFHDALNGIGTVVFDVVGGTITNALDKVLYLPREEQLAVGQRLRYCNMSGETVGNKSYVSSWPLLGRYTTNEHLFTTSQRPVELIRKTDRNLATASIQGLNRLSPLLTSIGIVLAALREPVHRAYDLLEGTEEWKTRLTKLRGTNPATRGAAKFLLAVFELPESRQAERTDVLRNKLFHLQVDPISQAMFSTTQPPTIDWEEVARKGLQVYIDLSGNEPKTSKELKIMWVWTSLMEYISSRGSRGREHPPLSIVIDELSYFVRGTALRSDVIAEEFREFAEVRSRNANTFLTIATQDLKQLPEEMQAAFLSMGNQLYGRVSDYQTAIELAQRLYPKDPKLVKDWHTVYTTESLNGKFYRAIPIDYQAVYYTLEEQDYMNSQDFMTLTKGEWLFAQTAGEGEHAAPLQKVATNGFDQGLYDSQNSDKIAKLRSYLMQRDGIPVPESLAESDPALPQHLQQRASAPAQRGNGKVAPAPPPPTSRRRRDFSG